MSAGSNSQKVTHPQVIHKEILEHIVPRTISVRSLVHIVDGWVRREAVIPLMGEVVAVVARPGVGGSLHGMANRIPRDDAGRLDHIGGILPSDKRTERTSARSGDGSNVGKCDPSGWHCTDK